MPMPVGKILYKSLQWKSLQFFTSFLVNIVFARALHAAVAGEFYSLVYFLSLIISFFTLGLDISLNYYLSRKEMDGAAARRIMLAVTGAAVLVSLPLIFFISRYPDVGISYLLLLAGLHITGGLLTALSGAIFTAGGKNHIPACIAFIFNSLLVALSLYCSSRWTGGSLIYAFFGLYFLFSFGQGCLLFFLSFRLSFAPQPTGLRLIEVLQFSFFAFLTNLLFFIAARLYIYIIPYYLTPYSQGNYIQSYKVVEYIGLAMSFTYYPFIALVAGLGEGRERMKDHLLLLVRLSNTAVLAFSIVAAVAGHWLFPFLFGPSFDRVSVIFTAFIPGLFAVCSSGFFTAWFFGAGQARYNLISACIQLLSMPLLFFLLNGPAAPERIALAFSLSNLLSLGYDLRIFKKAFSYGLRDVLWIRKADVKMILERVWIRAAK
jgi:O-antigen/teichoic acid export membrane protein